MITSSELCFPSSAKYCQALPSVPESVIATVLSAGYTFNTRCLGWNSTEPLPSNGTCGPSTSINLQNKHVSFDPTNNVTTTESIYLITNIVGNDSMIAAYFTFSQPITAGMLEIVNSVRSQSQLKALKHKKVTSN